MAMKRVRESCELGGVGSRLEGVQTEATAKEMRERGTVDGQVMMI